MQSQRTSASRAVLPANVAAMFVRDNDGTEAVVVHSSLTDRAAREAARKAQALAASGPLGLVLLADLTA